jgi:hypothetical protein
MTMKKTKSRVAALERQAEARKPSLPSLLIFSDMERGGFNCNDQHFESVAQARAAFPNHKMAITIVGYKD